MKTRLKTISRWLGGTLVLLLVVASAYVALLALPTPLFAHEARFADYRVYSDRPIPAEFGAVIEDATRRVAAMEHAPDRPAPRVFLCHSRKRYAFFARLVRRGPGSLALGLSFTNEIFVSMTRHREFAAANRGRIRHSRFEGDPAEAIAHEIAHFHSLHALGLRAHLAQPIWKSEGWAEYQANLSPIRDDPDYDLHDRIDLLLDGRYWGGGSGPARDLWAWQLLVEYLGEVRGYRLEDLQHREVTLVRTRSEMLAWHRDDRP